MYYVYVWVRTDRYRGSDALTYSSDVALATGAIVRVPLRDQEVLGFVTGPAPKPSFRAKAVSAVLEAQPLPLEDIRLAKWLSEFYATPIGVVASLFLPPKFTVRRETDTLSSAGKLVPLPPLTAEQQEALAHITKPDTYTLHGRTGSGKTRLYMDLAQQSLNSGKSALILCPEIGLTSQLSSQFRQAFDRSVVVLHSQLTAKEREIKWLRVLEAKDPLIVIGPRSALFSPLHNLGLIVVDESHDPAYKQQQPPYYHAARVASELRVLHDATLVFGSATPPVTDYFMAAGREKPIIRLSRLAKEGSARRHLSIVDLKDRTHFSRSTYLSDTLLASANESLSRGEQTLLYLNRRGTARVTVCDHCGWQALCPHCDLPLTYHGDAFRLRCHTCGFSQGLITACPNCGNPSVTFHSFGTKAVAAEAERLFPGAKILRFDTDNTKQERLEEQYTKILDGGVDILVGTQILAKGLDLPRLSTLGVVLADSSLYLPDYTAQERTYQLLTQVIGRIGRGHITSRAIIQTYYPESQLLRAALDDDWETFYQSEIAERRKYAFPPFYYLLKLLCRRTTAQAAESAMTSFKAKIETSQWPVIVDGPAPAFHEKVSGKYQWQLVVKARSRSNLLAVLKLLPNGWTYDLDPIDLL